MADAATGRDVDGDVQGTAWDILTGDTERDRRNVGVLLQSVAELYGPRSLDDVLRQALDRTIDITGAQRAMLLVAEGDEGLKLQMARDQSRNDLGADARYSTTVSDKVWRSGDSHLTVDAAGSGAENLAQSFVDLKLLSVMATPLPVKDGGRLGVLYVDSTVQVKEFTEAEFQVFKALGGLVAIAVQNAQHREQEKESERLRQELEVARQIQQRLLPATLPEQAGWELAAVGMPCDETSGDYYDVLPLPDRRLALVMGDVSGHGLGSALFMVATRALVHSLLRTEPGLPQVVGRLNDFLERDMPVSSFMSMFIGVLDLGARTLEYVSAGHNPPLLVRADGSLERLERTGPVLGVLSGHEYALSDPIDLAEGDALLLYTDGIFEAHSAEREMYGEERLAASLMRHVQEQAAAQGALDHVLADLLRFVKGVPFDDDVTAILVRLARA